MIKVLWGRTQVTIPSASAQVRAAELSAPVCVSRLQWDVRARDFSLWLLTNVKTTQLSTNETRSSSVENPTVSQWSRGTTWEESLGLLESCGNWGCQEHGRTAVWLITAVYGWVALRSSLISSLDLGLCCWGHYQPIQLWSIYRGDVPSIH